MHDDDDTERDEWWETRVPEISYFLSLGD